MAEKKASQRALTTLRERVLDGSYPPGERFLSIQQVADEFQLTYGTAANVVRNLRVEGWIESRHGSGSFVREFQTIRRSSPSRLVKSRWLDGKAIQDSDTTTRPRVVDVVVAEVPAPDWVAAPLDLSPDDPVVSRSRRFLVEDRPVQLAVSYYVKDMVQGTAILYTDTGPGGSYARLAEIGHEPTHFTEFVRARMPKPDETTALRLPPGTPVLDVTRHAFAKQDRCVEVNHMTMDGSAYELDYSFEA